MFIQGDVKLSHFTIQYNINTILSIKRNICCLGVFKRILHIYPQVFTKEKTGSRLQ